MRLSLRTVAGVLLVIGFVLGPVVRVSSPDGNPPVEAVGLILMGISVICYRIHKRNHPDPEEDAT